MSFFGFQIDSAAAFTTASGAAAVAVAACFSVHTSNVFDVRMCVSAYA